MNITINGNPVEIDPETIVTLLPTVLPGIFMLISFLVFFGIIGSVIKKTTKSIRQQFPAGTLREIQNIRRQLPKGVAWQDLINQWDIKIDRESGKIKIKKKAVAGESSVLPTEMKVTELAQLPQALRQMLNVTDQNITKSMSQASAKRASMPQANRVDQSANPFLNEGAGTILKIALGVVILIAMYVVGFFLA